MAHDINTAPEHPYKKGDKVQHIGTGMFATVTEDQKDFLTIKVRWDKSDDRTPEAYRPGAFRKIADAVHPPMLKAGDRVKHTSNQECGTIKRDQVSENDRNIIVTWDNGHDAWEEIRYLRTTNPNQEAIDAIDVKRAELEKEISKLQSRLAKLDQAKKLLED